MFVLVLQPKRLVALRPPPVADKGSKALSEITSKRQYIYVQRIAVIFQTGEHGSPLQYNNYIVAFIELYLSQIICGYLRASDERPYRITTTLQHLSDFVANTIYFFYPCLRADFILCYRL